MSRQRRFKGLDPRLGMQKRSVIKCMVAIFRDVMGLSLEEVMADMVICWRIMERYDGK